MRELFGRLWMFGWYLTALAIFAGLMWWVAKAHSHMWRLVAARYRGRPASARIARKLETSMIATRGLRVTNPFGNHYRRYTVLLELYADGLALVVVPPLNIMCPPLFLPFDEMELKPTDWALWREPFAIRMRRLPDTDIIIDRDTVRWIREFIDQSPFGLGI